MHSYPLETVNINEALQMQFKLVECIAKHFTGTEFLNNGDLGVVYGQYPEYTKKVENTLADFFRCEDAVLIRCAGTGAIREYISLILNPNDEILVHDAPVYSTTATTLSTMGINAVKVDYNENVSGQLNKLSTSVKQNIKMALIQHSRQRIEDRYDISEVISYIKKWNRNVKIVVDDNYTAMKTKNTGIGLGADASCFSLFKLLGREGIGCVLCSKEDGDKIRKKAYSGGSKVQGFEAMECLRSLVYAPVAFAIASLQVDEVVKRLNSGEISEISEAVKANAQSAVALVKFNKPIAKKALDVANRFGAAPYPVGAESKYEVTPMFYRMSGAFIEDDPSLADYVIRINPMRAGAGTVIRILKEIIKECVV